jgi:hypothetical protein
MVPKKWVRKDYSSSSGNRLHANNPLRTVGCRQVTLYCAAVAVQDGPVPL